MKKAVVLLADGFEEVEAITPIDFLRRAEIDVTVAGVTGRDVVGAHDIRVNTDITVDELIGSFDAVVIPGGKRGAENIASNADAIALIRRQLDAGRLVAAICASPGVVLGGHDLIGDRAYTCYPGFEERVSGGRFSEERVVSDGNLITSRGPGTAAEFAFEVIRALGDPAAADRVHRLTLQK